MKQKWTMLFTKVMIALLIVISYNTSMSTVDASDMPVSEITINYGYDAVPLHRSVDFQVMVTPSDASDSSISVVLENGTGAGTLTEIGEPGANHYSISGDAAGTVILKATANDGSGIVATKQLDVIPAFSLAAFTLEGRANEAITPVEITATKSNRVPVNWPRNLPLGEHGALTDYVKTNIILNLPDGITATLDDLDTHTMKVTLDGTPTVAFSGEAQLGQEYFPNESCTFNIQDAPHTHTPSEWIVDKEQTDAESGLKHKECTVCKEILQTETIPPYSYSVTVGKGNTWTENTNTGMEFVIDADYDKFQELKIDGKIVDKAYYTVRKGSTIITLKPEYLKSLAIGTHNISAVFDGKEVPIDFSVKKPDEAPNTNLNSAATPNNPQNPKSPQTGDASNYLLWIILAGASTLIGRLFVTKRENHSGQ